MNHAEMLIISDDIQSARVWSNGLIEQNIRVRVTDLDVMSIDPAIIGEDYILVVIDTYEKETDAIDICRLLRAHFRGPILLFTYQRDERYQLRAYEAGVDDCIAKPIGLRLHLTKIRVWLRRISIARGRESDLQVGGFRFDPRQRQVSMPEGTIIKLSNLESRLLALLMINQGRVLEADLIIDRVWLNENVGDKSLSKTLVHRLRKKIEPNASNPRYLQSVVGQGYIFSLD